MAKSKWVSNMKRVGFTTKELGDALDIFAKTVYKVTERNHPLKSNMEKH